MAEFDGITAARANEILGMSVVSGEVNESGHLILTRANGQTIDAGDFTANVSAIIDDAVGTEVAAQIPDAVAGTYVNKGNVTGAITFTEFNNVNLVNAMIKAVAIGNITINSANLPSSPKPNTQFAMRIQQDATGGRTLALTGFKKSQGVLSLSTGASDIDILVFLYDGTEWMAGMMGADFS